jgi:hypothetical protein
MSAAEQLKAILDGSAGTRCPACGTILHWNHGENGVRFADGSVATWCGACTLIHADGPRGSHRPRRLTPADKKIIESLPWFKSAIADLDKYAHERGLWG